MNIATISDIEIVKNVGKIISLFGDRPHPDIVSKITEYVYNMYSYGFELGYDEGFADGFADGNDEQEFYNEPISDTEILEAEYVASTVDETLPF